MLNEHLICKTRPEANEKNVVLWQDYRVTVLGERLFRIEKSAEKIFRNAATIAVWFLDVPPQRFTAEEKGESLIVSTPSVTLIIKQNREDCRIIVDGEEKPVDNSGNLMGTYRTLDGFDGDIDVYHGEKIQLGYGVCSKTGVRTSR